MATLTHATADGAAFGSRASASRGLTGRVHAWIERRREIARIEFELSTYTERNLADLGLSREDIPEVARGRFQRA